MENNEGRHVCRIVACGKYTQRCGVHRNGKPRYRSVCRYHRKMLKNVPEKNDDEILQG